MNPAPLPANDTETVAMELLRDLVAASWHALHSLDARIPEPRLINEYFFYSARQINNATAGFSALRDRDLRAGAKLLVRPAIEAVFRLYAVKNKPELVYRILYSEAIDHDKWAGRMAHLAGIEEKATSFESPEWQTFRAACVKAFGEDKVKDTPVTLRDVAREAGFEQVYTGFYSMYCKHTHGSLAALKGGFDVLSDPADTWVTVMSSMDALRFLVSLGGECRDFQRLSERWKAVAFRLKDFAINRDVTPNPQSQHRN